MNTLSKSCSTAAISETRAKPEADVSPTSAKDAARPAAHLRTVSASAAEPAPPHVIENHRSGCCRLILSTFGHADSPALAQALLAVEGFFQQDHDAVQYRLRQAESSGLRLHIDRDLLHQDEPIGRGMAWYEPDGTVNVFMSAQLDADFPISANGTPIETTICPTGKRWVSASLPISEITGEPLLHATWCQPAEHEDGRAYAGNDPFDQTCRSSLRLEFDRPKRTWKDDPNIEIEIVYTHPRIGGGEEATNIIVTTDDQNTWLDDPRAESLAYGLLTQLAVWRGQQAIAEEWRALAVAASRGVSHLTAPASSSKPDMKLVSGNTEPSGARRSRRASEMSSTAAAA